LILSLNNGSDSSSCLLSSAIILKVHIKNNISSSKFSFLKIQVSKNVPEQNADARDSQVVDYLPNAGPYCRLLVCLPRADSSGDGRFLCFFISG